MKSFPKLSRICPLLCLALGVAPAAAQIDITDPDVPYVQDFDIIPPGPNITYEWVDNTTIPGWYLYITGGTNPDLAGPPGPPTGTTPDAGIRSTNLGGGTRSGVYFYWTRADDESTNHSLTTVPNDSSSHLMSGMRLRNLTGRTLHGFRLSYTGRQWRVSTSTNLNAIVPEWRLGNPANLNDGLWYRIHDLAFVSPAVAAPDATENLGTPGMEPSHSAVMGPVEVTGIEWEPGTDLWIRFFDTNDGGVDHGMGIDDVVFTALENPEPPPGAVIVTRAGQVHTEDFDLTLGHVRSEPWRDGVTLQGWYAWIMGGSGATPLEPSVPDVFRYSNLASGTSGGVYFYMLRSNSSATDHAFGGVSNISSGELRYAIRLINRSGITLDGFRLSYTGEQWRTSTSASQQEITVDFKTGPLENLGGGDDWTPIPELTFVSPKTGAAANTGIDGNADENRQVFDPVEITGIEWADGDDLWIVFTKGRGPGTDHGLMIDDFRIQILGDMPPVEPVAPDLTASISGDEFVLSWHGLAGLSYQVQQATDSPSSQAFSNVGLPIEPDADGPVQVTFPVSSSTAFYRVQVSSVGGIAVSDPVSVR